jgi:hypothetical protein
VPVTPDPGETAEEGSPNAAGRSNVNAVVHVSGPVGEIHKECVLEVLESEILFADL